MAQPYSDEFKAEVLETYRTDGPSEAARRHGVHKTTLLRWARAAGVVTVSGTKKATEAACEALEAVRARLRTKLALRADEMLDRLNEPMTVYVGSGANPTPVEIARPNASTCRDFATTAAILIDKLQLLSGEATERVEQHTTDDLSRLSTEELKALRDIRAKLDRPDGE
jgi:transposase-like protein